MSYEISKQQEPDRHLVVKRFTATPDRIGPLVSEAFGVVYEFVGRHGLRPIGAPVACYLMGPGDEFEVLAGCALESPIEPEGALEPYLLHGCTTLATEHVGPYDELPKAYEALEAHARATGEELDRTVMWEQYLTGPEVPPEKMRTIIHWPLH
jgi:effector-binding domain-containing protein